MSYRDDSKAFTKEDLEMITPSDWKDYVMRHDEDENRSPGHNP